MVPKRPFRRRRARTGQIRPPGDRTSRYPERTPLNVLRADGTASVGRDQSQGGSVPVLAKPFIVIEPTQLMESRGRSSAPVHSGARCPSTQRRGAEGGHRPHDLRLPFRRRYEKRCLFALYQLGGRAEEPRLKNVGQRCARIAARVRLQRGLRAPLAFIV